jgi:RimJ/RimL family protein N-acetyltransferase
MSATPASGLVLVPLAARHQQATLDWMNDPALMPTLNRLHLITPEEHDRWFASLPGRRDVSYFAIEAGGSRRHAGNIWLHAIDPVHRKAEVRIMLAPAEAGAGLGTAAILAAADYAFGRLQLHRLTACVIASNQRSRRAFEKAGFVVEGTLREDRWDGKTFVDTLLLARLTRP